MKWWTLSLLNLLLHQMIAKHLNHLKSVLVKEDFSVGAEVINIKALQETYPHLAVLESIKYCYGSVDMTLGDDLYHAIRTLECFAEDEKSLPFAVH